jgi:cytochrome c oxidase cbb3-type subunit III
VRRVFSALLCLIALPASAQFPPSFPGQMRPPGNPEHIARGTQIYAGFCRSCHGADLRGGDLGGPNLLRSQLVLNDQAGEGIGPVITNGRTPTSGTAMPPMPMSAEDIQAVAAYLHSVIAKAQPQGAPPASEAKPLNILVGNARAGERYFKATCTPCHTATGDLAGIASRIPVAEQLQNSWVAGRRFGPSVASLGPPVDAGPQAPNPRRIVRVTVQRAEGSSLTGRLQRIDDFIVSLIDDAGEYRSFSRRHADPAIVSVTVDDPLARHRQLLSTYTDQDMHNVTAYLATLK